MKEFFRVGFKNFRVDWFLLWVLFVMACDISFNRYSIFEGAINLLNKNIKASVKEVEKSYEWQTYSVGIDNKIADLNREIDLYSALNLAAIERNKKFRQNIPIPYKTIPDSLRGRRDYLIDLKNQKFRKLKIESVKHYRKKLERFNDFWAVAVKWLNTILYTISSGFLAFCYSRIKSKYSILCWPGMLGCQVISGILSFQVYFDVMPNTVAAIIAAIIFPIVSLSSQVIYGVREKIRRGNIIEGESAKLEKKVEEIVSHAKDVLDNHSAKSAKRKIVNNGVVTHNVKSRVTMPTGSYPIPKGDKEAAKLYAEYVVLSNTGQHGWIQSLANYSGCTYRTFTSLKERVFRWKSQNTKAEVSKRISELLVEFGKYDKPEIEG
jgi:hypothetical protein